MPDILNLPESLDLEQKSEINKSTPESQPQPTFEKPRISALELAREQLKEKKRQEEIARVRAEIEQLNQEVQAGQLDVSSQVRLDLQQAQNQIATNSDYLGKTTLGFYRTLIEKERKKASQESNQGNAAGGLSEAEKLLQFGSGSGENDSQQKAA